jgi:exopolysaccharide biosynthesis polyprenyl glycosylphosphotransferase
VAAPDFIASTLHVEPIAPPRAARRTASRELFKVAITATEVVSDFAACVFGTVAAYVFTALAIAPSFLPGTVLSAAPLGAALGLIVVTLSFRDGAYRMSNGLMRIRETERAIRVSFQALLLLLSIRLILGLGASWPQSIFALFLVPTLLILEKQSFSLIAAKFRREQGPFKRTVIFGTGGEARRVLSNLLQSPRLGLDPVAVVGDTPAFTESSVLEIGYRGRQSIQVECRPLSASLLKAYRCDMLLLAVPDLSQGEMAAATRAAHQAGSDVAVLRDAGFPHQPFAETIDVDGIMFTASREHPDPWLYQLVKRIADIVASSLLIVLLAPLLAFIAILVRLDSPGPALFVQKRVGRNGEFFRMFKFRSMFAHAPRYANSPKSSGDPRLTRVGRVLRRVSLDELPQLFNVLMGTMSLVGPRPEMPFVVERYDARQRTRLRVKPGITGLWQLSADRAFPIHQNLEYDLYYIDNRTFSMDAAILIHTLVFALCGGV